VTVDEWVAASRVMVQHNGNDHVASLLVAGHQVGGPRRPNRTYALLALAGMFDNWVDTAVGTTADRELYIALASLIRGANPLRVA